MNKKYAIERLQETIKLLNANEDNELRGLHVNIGHPKGGKITGQIDIYWDNY